MKIRNIILYILSAILFLGYLLIFFRGIDTSRATDAYNLFYVTRESKHYFTQGYLNDKYCTDILFEYKEDGNYINQSEKGWGDPEENGTWIIGNEASAYIVVNDTSKDYLFTVYSRKDNGYDNELYINGDFAGKLVFEGGSAELLIPGEILTEGTNTFTFKTDDYVYAVNEVYPDSKDERHLYMFVESFILSSVPQDATASGT
ncbi:MAG TPA: hypothetical protein DCW41_06545 [Clostridiales bacterium]|nr:hypothetical protein [Clostridiales bacterium]